MSVKQYPSLDRVSYEARLYDHGVYYGFAQYCFWHSIVATEALYHSDWYTDVPAYFVTADTRRLGGLSMTMIFSDLTTSDWAEFESHAPAACAWLLARALEREYARLEALPVRTAWQERRLRELHARILPAPAPHPVGWMEMYGTDRDMDMYDY